MHVLVYIVSEVFNYVNISLILFLVGISVGQYLLHDFVRNEGKQPAPRPSPVRSFRVYNLLRESQPECIADRFVSLQELMEAVKAVGLHHLNPIVAVDFTASNEWQGRKTFGGRSLHELHGNRVHNPFQKILNIIEQNICSIYHDQTTPIYGFGGKNSALFSLRNDFMTSDLLEAYNAAIRRISLSGPSSFSPIIYKALESLKEERKFRLLIIVSDGQMSAKDQEESMNALVDASNYPLSIVVIGVGDGPFDVMTTFDDIVQGRKFDNFQYVRR